MGTSLWVGRPTTPLTDIRFLESQTILSSKGITKTSIATCHPRLMRGATEVYVAYIESGVAKVTKSLYVEDMPRHIWVDTGFSAEATDVALCFDGSMPKAPNGWIEFKTEQDPWVFWVLNGVLYGNRLSSKEPPVVIAEANCTAVTAVRALWSDSGDYNFGLVVFFVLDGSVHYRQLISGEWKDAEVVTFGPKVTWSEISAFRTWDYRIGIQGKATDGTIYEMFTQFMGIGKQTAEHIDIRNASITNELKKIQYTNVNNNAVYSRNDGEHIDIANVSVEMPLGGLYPAALPVITDAYNIEDENGDWGTTVVVKFSNKLNPSTIEGNSLQFTVTDSWGVVYYPDSIALKEDGITLVLSFTNLNQAFDVCTLTYIPGTIKSLIDDTVAENSASFVPQNLKPVDIPKPEVELIWNE